MSEMIERAARALVVELASQGGDDIEPSDVRFEQGLTLQYIDQNTVDVGGLVRAVLQAIREPSEAMVRAGDQVDMLQACKGDPTTDYPNTIAIYRAMIDAALKE